MQNKPVIMLHIIMPNQVSGPNISNYRIAHSYLSDKYEFVFLMQTYLAGGQVNLKLIRDLKHQIKAFKPDIIHLSGLQSSGFHAVMAARLAGYKKIIVTVHGFAGDAINLSKIKRFSFAKIFEPLTLKMADKIITVCKEAAQKEMVRKCKEKFIGVIHNAAPIIPKQVFGTRERIRKEFFAEENDILIAISGRMIYDKGISFISQAIADMDLKGKRFIFIGNGNYCDILMKEHSKAIEDRHVLILGQRSDVLEILTGCDIFLFATLHENLSNALLEACTLGLPVIATDVGGNPEVIKDGVNGYLIPPSDSVAIKERVEMLCENAELRKQFANNSKEIIRENFSQQYIYSQIEKIYQSYIEE